MAKTITIRLVPDNTTCFGSDDFYWGPWDVKDYGSLELSVWRGKMPSGGTFALRAQESMDRQVWTDLFGADPGADSESVYSATLSMPWLRLKLVLGTSGSDPIVTFKTVAIPESRLA